VLTGDFLGPFFLSKLVQGIGMLDCLNRVGITHVCLGNHECNVFIEVLKECIAAKQSHQCNYWVNTSNMQALNETLYIQIPAYDVVSVTNKQGKNKTKNGLLGPLTNQDGLYHSETAVKQLMKELQDQVDFGFHSHTNPCWMIASLQIPLV
jgi:2',3'-cyclic-nucleotide 2'-phosphodiesterase (5'-nucleotidase family)